MVGGVVNQAVVGEDDSLCAAAAFAMGINITFIVQTTCGGGKQTFTVIKLITANGAVRSILFHAAAFPAKFTGLCFGEVITGQMAVGMKI